ncbi:unnamed protein product [Mytilus edulis]|uniref:Uncharacterized protein n=1 Tax=Mytilus edulis TaxID=6550 RepID=A0A8S3SQU2_MYTED|nr:unnamed protein product [Mytilus edulis]
MSGLCCLLFLTLFVYDTCVIGGTERNSKSGIFTTDDQDQTDSIDTPPNQQNKQPSKALSEQKSNLNEPALTSDKKQQQSKQPSTEVHESVLSSEKTNRLSEPASSSTHRNKNGKPLQTFEQNDEPSDLATSPSNKRDKQPEPEEDPESSTGKETKPSKPSWSINQNNIPTSLTGFASNAGLP